MRVTSGVILLAGLVLAARSGRTQFAYGYIPGYTNPPPVSAQVMHEEGPGLLPADRAYVNIGADKFAFVVPSGFKLEPSTGRVVTMVSADYSCQISFRLAGAVPGDESALSPESYSSKVLEDFSGAKIVRTFSAIADSRRGPAFEIQLPGPSGSSRQGRVAFIPSRAAMLEFSLVCTSEKFENACRQFSAVMLTFRASDAKGELHISPLSDKL